MSDEWILICHGLAGRENSDPAIIGQYLESYDPEAYDGRGSATWTNDLAKAMRFDGLTAAMNEWRRRSTKRRVRPDGKPNRPLTAFNVEPRPVPRETKEEG